MSEKDGEHKPGSGKFTFTLPDRSVPYPVQSTSADGDSTANTQPGNTPAADNSASTTTSQQPANRVPLLQTASTFIVSKHDGTVGYLTPKELIARTNEKDNEDFKAVDVYTILYSVNQNDRVIRVWLIQRPAGKGEDPKLDVPCIVVDEDLMKDQPKATLAEWGLMGVSKTPAKKDKAFAIDTVVMQDREGGRLSVAALVRCIDTEGEVSKRAAEREVDGVWQTKGDVHRGDITFDYPPVVNMFRSKAVPREITEGFDVLEKVRAKAVGESPSK